MPRFILRSQAQSRPGCSSASDAIKEGAQTEVKAIVSDQATFAARQVGGLANALQRDGTELEGSDQKEAGKYTAQIGRGVEDFARRMEGKDFRRACEYGRSIWPKAANRLPGHRSTCWPDRESLSYRFRQPNRATVFLPSAAAFDSNVNGGSENGQ